MKRKLTSLLIVAIGIIYVLMLISSRNPLIVDDVYQTNTCDGLLEKADVLYIIPNFENNSINNNEDWCAKIKSLNKTIGLHGIKHSYHEFEKEIHDEELVLAIKEFEKAISYNPKSADAHYNLGIVYMKKGKEKHAVPYFEKAIELNPEYRKKIRLS